MTELLNSIGFADRLSEVSRQKLASQISSIELPQGTDILHPGEVVDGVYFVRHGSLRVYYIDDNAKEGTLYWIKPGESCILALNSLFTEIPYPAFAAADEDTELISVSGVVFRELFSSEPSVQSFLFDELSCRVFSLLKTLESKMRLPQEERLILFLLSKADSDNTIHLSHERIAHHLGTVREVISRLLRILSGQRLIEVKQGKIMIKERASLLARLPEDMAEDVRGSD